MRKTLRTVAGHKISFFGIAKGGAGRQARASWMQNGDFHWSATCSCGWASEAQDAKMARVDEQVLAHKINVASREELIAAGYTPVTPEPVVESHAIDRFTSEVHVTTAHCTCGASVNSKGGEKGARKAHAAHAKRAAK